MLSLILVEDSKGFPSLFLDEPNVGKGTCSGVLSSTIGLSLKSLKTSDKRRAVLLIGVEVEFLAS